MYIKLRKFYTPRQRVAKKICVFIKNMTLIFPIMKGEKSAPALIKLVKLVVVGLLVCSIFFYLPACFSATQQETLAVAVDYIIDGDSLVIRRDTKTMEVRLWGIDAPEYDQPDSDSAKAALMKLALERRAKVQIKYRDRYGRYVALLYIDGLNVNETMVRTGHSWVYERYCDEPLCESWKRLEDEARKNKRGLWAGSNPVAPWRWKARR